MKNYFGIILILIVAVSCTNNIKQEENKQEAQKSYDVELSDKLSFFTPIAVSDSANEKLILLGQHLYFDKQLSKKQNISCNSCHNLETYGVDNAPTSEGDEGKFGGRNSPTTLNAFFHSTQFWDGRAKDVEQQSGMPILNPIEMNIPTEGFLIKRLQNSPMYIKLFSEAFPNEKQPITYENLKKAIGAFERQLATPSKFDDYLKGNKEALSESEKKGLVTFITTGCVTCHNGVVLGGTMFQKFGIYGNYWNFTKSKNIDEGKFQVTNSDADKYVFKVPSLRNIEKTFPYFHDGSVQKLEDAIKIMAKLQLNKDLSQEEITNIAIFLKTLTADIPQQYKTAPK